MNYAALHGPDFERLCFHLLLADGRYPLFFGKSGQAQFGIDLIVYDGNECEVYQCKNVPDYSVRDFKRDLGKFEREWLIERPTLPRPSKFILCCTAPLRDRDAWVDEKTRFFESSGGAVIATCFLCLFQNTK